MKFIVFYRKYKKTIVSLFLILSYPLLFLVLCRSSSQGVVDAQLPITGEKSIVEKKKTALEIKEKICGNTSPQSFSLFQTSDEFMEYPLKTITYNDSVIPYENTGKKNGQKWIDDHRYESVATWGGNEKFHGADGLNTHFIGHNPGIFEKIMNAKVGEQLIVTDEKGHPTQYAIQKITQVNHAGYEVKSNTELLPQITGKDGGERITLQACIDDKINLIVFAYLETN